MQAYGYLRVSGPDQVNGDGFTRQKLAIENYARANGLEIVRWFEEQICGEVEGAGRPMWSEMVKACAESGVSTVVIEALHRLARDLMAQETILRSCMLARISVISTAEPDLMSTDPTRVMIRQILGSVSQYDKAQIVAKLRSARQRKKTQTGRCEGIKPYGSLPGESEVLEHIKSLAQAGFSVNAIARALNNEGVKPRLAARWHPFTISGILDNLGLRKGKPAGRSSEGQSER
jgi:DNA invertase Pin-like site-specific DNA recombinase